MIKKQRTLFILYTPFHQLMANEIIFHYNLFNQAIVLDYNKNKNNNFSEIFSYEFLGTNKVYKIFKTLLWRFFYKYFIKRYQIKSIIIPHVDGLLTNLFFQRIHQLKYCSLSLFHEGVLSFYKFDKGTLNKHSNFSFLFLFKFYNYPNIFPVENDKIKHVYSPFNKYTVIPKEKLVKIPLNSFSFKYRADNYALYLGQPLYNYSKSDIDKVHLKIKEFLKKRNIEYLYIKMHPAQKDNVVQYFSDFQIINIDKENAIETIANEIQPSFVISFNSSALMNLKIANPEVEFVSINTCSNISKPENKIYEVFEKYNIKVHII